MPAIGSGPDEWPVLPLILASNASMNVYTKNTVTKFTNLLADPITRGVGVSGLVISLTKIAVPFRLLPQEQRIGEPTDVLQIHIPQIEPQIVNRSLSPLLASFSLKDAAANQGKKEGSDGEPPEYIFYEFDNPSTLPLKDKVVSALGAHLTNIQGISFPLADNLPPAFLEMEVRSSESGGGEMSVFCMSHCAADAAFYPQNTLTDFKAQLPSPMSFAGWEMSVAGLSMPAVGGTRSQCTMGFILSAGMRPTREERSNKVKLQLDPDLESAASAAAVIESLADAISDESSLRNILLVSFETKGADSRVDSFKLTNISEKYYVTVFTSRKLNGVLGHTYAIRQYVLRPQSDDVLPPLFIDLVKANSDTLAPSEFRLPPLGLLYCDILKPLPVGDTLAPLAEIVPIAQFEEGHGTIGERMYRPKIPHYHDVRNSEISAIAFKIMRADGKPITVRSVAQSAIASTGGTVVELRFRLKKTDGKSFSRPDISRSDPTWMGVLARQRPETD
jgi:hypothetical protein